jgi:hypothetical protein
MRSDDTNAMWKNSFGRRETWRNLTQKVLEHLNNFLQKKVCAEFSQKQDFITTWSQRESFIFQYFDTAATKKRHYCRITQHSGLILFFRIYSPWRISFGNYKKNWPFTFDISAVFCVSFRDRSVRLDRPESSTIWSMICLRTFLATVLKFLNLLLLNI